MVLNTKQLGKTGILKLHATLLHGSRALCSTFMQQCCMKNSPYTMQQNCMQLLTYAMQQSCMQLLLHGKFNIHDATKLHATVACNFVASCMVGFILFIVITCVITMKNYAQNMLTVIIDITTRKITNHQNFQFF